MEKRNWMGIAIQSQNSYVPLFYAHLTAYIHRPHSRASFIPLYIYKHTCTFHLVTANARLKEIVILMYR